MAKTVSAPTKRSGQISETFPAFLTRLIPQWTAPEWLSGYRWKRFVQNQPFLIIARDTLIENMLALEWRIEPRDSEMQDELKDEIDFYTAFLTHTGDYHFSEIVEWTGQDLLDLPFGSAAELGRRTRTARPQWLELIDGSTLFPTLNRDVPIGQQVPEASLTPVYFEKDRIVRTYMTPRTELRRRGWGMAPPEKIYLAAQLLYHGDRFYSNLLIDTPEAGILDLGDMSKESALNWVDSFRTLMTGIDPMKIPVLYEHEKAANWIPFGRSPSELSYNSVTMRYAALVAGGYGLSLSDLGIQAVTSGGETLAGSIRQERRTRKTGIATVKRKLKEFFDAIIHPDLQFNWIDYDDEVNVAKGRALLAYASASSSLIKSGMFSAPELRRQALQDGVVTVSVPEEIPEDESPEPMEDENLDLRDQMGRPVPPSQGGHGEVTEDGNA